MRNRSPFVPYVVGQQCARLPVYPHSGLLFPFPEHPFADMDGERGNVAERFGCDQSFFVVAVAAQSAVRL